MGGFPRKSDGRRVFTVEFKRATVQRIVAGEKTVAAAEHREKSKQVEQESDH